MYNLLVSGLILTSLFSLAGATESSQSEPNQSPFPACSLAAIGENRDFRHRSEQAERAAALTKAKLSTYFDLTISARKGLQACIGSDRADCPQKIAEIKKLIGQKITMLRYSLALSGTSADGILGKRTDAISPRIALPSYFGGSELAPLSRGEIQAARALRQRILGLIDQFEGHDKNGKSMDKDALIRMCEAAGEARECRLYHAYQINQKIWFQSEMQSVSSKIIDSLPMIIYFGRGDFSDEQLASSLERSKRTLEHWKSEVLASSNPGSLFYDYPKFANEVLHKNPELCAPVVESYQRAKHISKLKKYGVVAGSVVALVGACVYGTPLGCAAGGGILSGTEIALTLSQFHRLKERFLASDDQRAVQSVAVDEALTDLIVSVAFAGFEGLPMLGKIARPGLSPSSTRHELTEAISDNVRSKLGQEGATQGDFGIGTKTGVEADKRAIYFALASLAGN